MVPASNIWLGVLRSQIPWRTFFLETLVYNPWPDSFVPLEGLSVLFYQKYSEVPFLHSGGVRKLLSAEQLVYCIADFTSRSKTFRQFSQRSGATKQNFKQTFLFRIAVPCISKSQKMNSKWWQSWRDVPRQKYGKSWSEVSYGLAQGYICGIYTPTRGAYVNNVRIVFYHAKHSVINRI